jgi:hypothetical protein
MRRRGAGVTGFDCGGRCLRALPHRPGGLVPIVIERAGVLALFLVRDPNRGMGRLEDDDAQDRRPPRAQARRTQSRSHDPPGLVGDRCPTPSECPASGRHPDESRPGRFERSAPRGPGAIVRLAGPVDAAFRVSGVQDAPTRHGRRNRSDRGSTPRLRLPLGASRRLGVKSSGTA